MAERIWLDSETYSEVNIDAGVVNYTNACFPILITYAFDDEDVQVWEEGQPLPADLVAEIESGTPVYAHNALFDYLALKDTLPLKLEQMRDTMAIATANHLPASLDGAGKILGIMDAKLSSGKALIRWFCIPDKKGNKRDPKDSPEKWQQFIEYAVIDVVAMRQTAQMCNELSEFEQKVWAFTQRMNLRGVPINLENANHFNELAAYVKKQLNEELYELTGIGSASQVAKLLAWVREQGLEIEGLAKDKVMEAFTMLDTLPEDKRATVKRVLEIRQQASMTSLKKYEVFERIAHNGRVHGAFTYHMASTGRYSSRGGLNLQNVPRGAKAPIALGNYDLIKQLSPEDYLFFYGGDLLPLVSTIRPTIEAPEGRKFVCYDYSSIENRVAPFIGGEPKSLALFADGLDEYIDFATDVYGVAYEDVTSEMRTMSKPAVLSAIFGSGAKGVQAYYHGFGIGIELDRAQEMVDLYRAKHPGIHKAWRNFNKAAIRAVKKPGTVFTTNRCKIASTKRFLRIMLPSGRVIQWFAPKVEMNKAPWGDMIEGVTAMMKPTQGSKWVRKQLIGSSIFQSVVQATARDILVEAMLRLEQEGYDVIMTVHDEIVAEVDADWSDEEEFERLVTINPEWCPEIPIAAEGWVGTNYRK